MTRWRRLEKYWHRWVKGKEKAHKRTISEVIPREEREVEREKETAQANAQVNGDSEVNEIAQIDKDNAPSGLRRSGRAAEVLNTMHDQVDSDLVYTRMQVFLYLSNNSNILAVQLVGRAAKWLGPRKGWNVAK
jgi:hypothetical protein